MTNTVEDEKRDKDGEVKGLADAGRRKAVKTLVSCVTVLAAYHVLPTRWETPIIESISLPAHAATSGTSLHDPCEVTWIEGYQDSHAVIIKVTGYVTPPTKGLATKIVATGNPDTTATATAKTAAAADGTFSATITLNTATGLGSVAVTTTVTGADGSAHCSVNVPQQASPPSGTDEHFAEITQSGTQVLLTIRPPTAIHDNGDKYNWTIFANDIVFASTAGARPITRTETILFDNLDIVVGAVYLLTFTYTANAYIAADSKTFTGA